MGTTETVYTDREGDVTLSMDRQGDVWIYDVETGDSLGLDERQLAAVGRMLIKAHVQAGQLKINRPRPMTPEGR